MVIGDRIPAAYRRWIRDEESMTEPLHTDDPAAEGNLTPAEYQRQHEERAARLGDAGLHVVPQEYLDAIGGDDGADR